MVNATKSVRQNQNYIPGFPGLVNRLISEQNIPVVNFPVGSPLGSDQPKKPTVGRPETVEDDGNPMHWNPWAVKPIGFTHYNGGTPMTFHLTHPHGLTPTYTTQDPAQIVVYSHDVKVHRVYEEEKKHIDYTCDYQADHKRGKRKAITSLSRASATRMKFEARNSRNLTHMITLTYPEEYPCDGATVKAHLHVMMQWLRRRGVSGFWFLEFQKRGAPHFHAFTDCAVDKHELSCEWYQIVGSGDEKHLRAGTRIERLRIPVACSIYVTKYANKAIQKQVPEEYVNVGRFWGHFGDNTRPQGEVLLSGKSMVMNQVIRVIRNSLVARKRTWSQFKVRRDNGKYSFVAYDAATCMRQLLHSEWFGDILPVERNAIGVN